MYVHKAQDKLLFVDCAKLAISSEFQFPHARPCSHHKYCAAWPQQQSSKFVVICSSVTPFVRVMC